MLTQVYRRAVDDQGAFIERTFVRGPRFGVAVVRARKIAIDYGSIAPAVTFRERCRRRQLSVLLSGHGYVDTDGGARTLHAGDVLQSDQRRHRGEGYGGSDCEIVILDWEPDCFQGSLPDGDAGSLDHASVAALRALVAELGKTPIDDWMRRLCELLRALGLPFLPAGLAQEYAQATAPAELRRLYSVLGHALSTLGQHPSLEEIAVELGTNVRQVNRRMTELSSLYGVPFTGWRHFLHEMRLDWTAQLLSVPKLPLDRVASLAGYRSTVALHHALALRGASTPAQIAALLARRWQ